MGTIAMFVVEPGRDDPELDRGLFLNAERYLRRRGAEVFYAGGQSPLDPFYCGLYGGSELSGILSSHAAFIRAAQRSGYEPSASSTILEAELACLEPRDPRGPLFRRQYHIDVTDDAMPSGWWQSLAIGLFRPTRFEMIDKAVHQPVAIAWTWDIAGGAGVGDGRSRAGLISLEVEASHRRRGLGRHLVGEIIRHVRAQSTDILAVQTSSENLPALGLYRSLGFEPVETATLYRLPAELTGRSR